MARYMYSVSSVQKGGLERMIASRQVPPPRAVIMPIITVPGSCMPALEAKKAPECAKPTVKM